MDDAHNIKYAKILGDATKYVTEGANMIQGVFWAYKASPNFKYGLIGHSRCDTKFRY